jgi:hypothetical protein
MLLCDEGILAVVVSLQTALTFGLDPALKLCACLRTYVSHASVKFPSDSRPLFHGRGSCECDVLLGLHVIDQGKVELCLDVVLEGIDPWLWAGTSCGDGLWHNGLILARGKGKSRRGLTK